MKNNIKKNMIRMNGFTLIEMIFVILIVAIGGIAISRFFSQSLILSRTAQNAQEALNNGENAIERMVQDIRQLRSSSDMTIFTSSQLSFVDSGGNTDDYSLSGSNLLFNNQILINNVSNLTFAYYDKNGTSTNTKNNIRYIRINLQLAGNASNINLTTAVFPRAFIS